MAEVNLRREGEVGLGRDSAVVIGTYFFAWIVQYLALQGIYLAVKAAFPNNPTLRTIKLRGKSFG
jgi:hypothetical protein